MIPDQGPWLDVDLGAVQRNARRYERLVGSRTLPMLKANAYGLGAVPVARALEAGAPWGYGVATLREAKELRDAAITRPLLAFWPLQPAEAAAYLELDVRPSVADGTALADWVRRSDRPFHVAIDTGMGRGGFRWHDAAALEEARALLRSSRGYEGAFTHFHSADTSGEATELQWTRFVRALEVLGGRPPLIHAANSAAAQWGDRFAGNLSRPGIFLYGGRAGELTPEPVARLSARVVAARGIRQGDTVSYGATFRAPHDAQVLTLGIGYADGVPRALAAHGRVWLAGEARPIAGRITMDLMMTVAPPGTGAVGDIAVLYGPELALDDQAEAAGTISYEMLTGVGRRVVRRYVG